MHILTYVACFVLQTAAPNWQTYKSTPEVDVLYRAEQCHDEVNGLHREYVLLKFVNKTDKKISVSWQLESYTNNVCNTCNSDEYKFDLVLEPNASQEGDCATVGQELRVFVKHLDLPNHKTFTKFELGNLTVELVKKYVPVIEPDF